MKRLKSLLLVLVLCLELLPAAALAAEPEPGSVPIDQDHFPDANFRAALAELPVGQDQVLTKEELSGITSLDLCGYGKEDTGLIRSLTGLAHLSALTELDCSCNALAELELSGNPKLTTLRCYQNELTGLDLSGVPELTILDCRYNHLVSLDLSGSAKLTGLSAEGNWRRVANGTPLTQLPELDLSKVSQVRGGDFEEGRVNITGDDGRGTRSMGYQYDCGREHTVEFFLEPPEDNVLSPILTYGYDRFAKLDYLTMTCNTPGAEIYYTTDGSVPTRESEKFYSDIRLEESAQFRAIAVKENMVDSPVVSYDYVGREQTAAPVISSDQLEVDEDTTSITITITCETPGAEIWYRIKGRDAGMLPYTEPIQLEFPEHTCAYTIHAVAGAPEMRDSEVTKVTYRKKTKKTPEFTTENRFFVDSMEIGFREEHLYTVYYTTDGTEPTEESTQYLRPFTVTETTTVKAILVKAGHFPSAMVTATFTRAENPFEDVERKDYFYQPILWAVDRGITKGVTETEFGPDLPCTRAQIVTFLWNAKGRPAPETKTSPFSDVKEDDWFFEAVMWAVEQGITSGVGDGQFGPNLVCSRAQAMTLLWQYMGRPTVEGDMDFIDVSETDWFYMPVKWAVQNQVTAGMGGNRFGVNEDCLRAQIATFLFKSIR